MTRQLIDVRAEHVIEFSRGEPYVVDCPYETTAEEMLLLLERTLGEMGRVYSHLTEDDELGATYHAVSARIQKYREEVKD